MSNYVKIPKSILPKLDTYKVEVFLLKTFFKMNFSKFNKLKKIIFWSINKTLNKHENIKNKVSIEVLIADHVISYSDFDLSQDNVYFEHGFTAKEIVF